MLKEIGSYDAKTKLSANDKFKAESAIRNILKAKKHKISDSDLKLLKEDARK